MRGGSVFRNGTCLASGRVLEVGELDRSLTAQKGRVTEALEAFAENTMRYLREEGSLLSEGVDFPPLTTRFRDRHALVVARGPGMKRDLRMVRPYVRDFKPVLIAVDGGADALLETGAKPDVIVGDMDSVSDRALQSGAEILVHAYRDGAAPGAARCEALGVPFQVVSLAGISEDIALLLAYEKGAELIVAVGTHFNLIEFLERDRAGMSSTFVTRLKVGEILVDAKGVSRLFSRRVGIWPFVLFAVAGLLAVVVAIARLAGAPRRARAGRQRAPRPPLVVPHVQRIARAARAARRRLGVRGRAVQPAELVAAARRRRARPPGVRARRALAGHGREPARRCCAGPRPWAICW